MNMFKKIAPVKLAIAVLIVAAALLYIGVRAFAPGGPGKDGTVLTLSEADFKRTIASGVHLVDFGAEWCGPCKIQEPIVNQTAKDFAGKVGVAKVDIDAERGLAEEFSVTAIPTLIIFKNGAIDKRLVGVQDAETLALALNAAL